MEPPSASTQDIAARRCLWNETTRAEGGTQVTVQASTRGGERRIWAFVVGVVAVTIGPGDRKSIQPMAARTGEVGYDRLHHFIGAGLWDSGPLEATLWEQADALVGGDKAWLIIEIGRAHV